MQVKFKIEIEFNYDIVLNYYTHSELFDKNKSICENVQAIDEKNLNDTPDLLEYLTKDAFKKLTVSEI